MHCRAAVALGLERRPVAGLFGMLVTVALGLLGLAFCSHRPTQDTLTRRRTSAPRDRPVMRRA